MTSNCPNIGISCGADTDCSLVTGNATCMNVLCGGGTCQSSNCSADSDCSKFGDGYTCVNGQCTSYGCSTSKPCPPNMTCSQGRCTSISCTTGMCPLGMKCTKLSNGQKICISNPGLGSSVRLLVLVMIVAIVVAVVLYLVYTKTGVSPLTIFHK